MKLAGAWASLVLVACTSAPCPSNPEVPAWPVVRGSIGGEELQWYVAFPQGKGVALCALEPADWILCRALDGLPMSGLRALDAGVWSPGSTFFLSARLEGTVPPALLADTRYVTGLLERSRAGAGDATFDSALETLVESVPQPEERTWAQAHRSDDALYARFAHHRATGTCHEDPIREATARLYAELALARHDLPTFAAVQLQLLDHQFPRVAWSSFIDTGPSTGAPRLLDSGLEVDRFFMGLVLQFPGSAPLLNDGRLARAIREAGRADALRPRLESLATSPSLDAYNRFRAAQVWLLLQSSDEAGATNLEAVKARARTLTLHPLARGRVEAER